MASFKRLHKDKLIYDSVQGAKSLNLIKGIKAHKPQAHASPQLLHVQIHKRL
jgi:hypothetical protein